MVEAIKKLDHKFDHERILTEYLLCQPNGTLPSKYTTTEVFNTTYSDVVKKNCPYTIEVCEAVKSIFDFNFVLFRLMEPHTTLSWHVDADCEPNSYHVPITTNSGCFFITDVWSLAMHECGQLYRVFTHDFHTFVNAGTTPRLHLNLIRDNRGLYLDRKFLG